MTAIFRSPFKFGDILICLISAFFSLFLFPIDFDDNYKFEITIKAKGTGHLNGKSTEVWLENPNAAELNRWPNKIESRENWSEKYGKMVSYENQPTNLSFTYFGRKKDRLTLSTHEYSGNASISVNGQLLDIDLYSKQAGKKEIPLENYVIEKSNFYFLKIVQIFGVFLVFFVLFLLMSKLTLKKQDCYKNEVSKKYYAPSVIFYSLPSVLIYFIFHLVVWPGQLSPDSIDLWSQVTNGNYSDNHPVIVTFVYKLFSLLVNKPAFAIAIGYASLALAIGLLLSEFENWGIKRFVLIVFSVLIPLFPANFLIATTLWKDVFYTTFSLLLLYLSLILLRKGWNLPKYICLLLVACCYFLANIRHNGIVVSVVFLFIVGVSARKFLAGKIFLYGLIFIICTFFLQKNVLYPLLDVKPIGQHYKSMHAVHLIGAMLSKGANIQANDSAVLEGFLSVDKWKTAYHCESVVPLFWGAGNGGFDYLGHNVSRINSIAWTLIKENPRIFISHQACLTSFLWRIKPKQTDWISISPMEITQIDEAKNLGLVLDSKFPKIKDNISTFVERYVINSMVFGRPALWTYTAIFLCYVFARRYGYKYLVLIIPILVNTFSMGILMSAQDYRYQFPVVMLSMMLIVFFLCKKVIR